MESMELRERALQVLCIADPQEKAARARALQAVASTLMVAPAQPPTRATVPRRPPRPELVHPAKVPRRSPAKPEGLAALLHAIAHIEFNAIKKAARSISSRVAHRSDFVL